MSFKAWARANAPKAYKPPKQPPKSTEPVLSVEAMPTAEFQPGDLIHFVSSYDRQVYYGRYIRTEQMTSYQHLRIWGYWSSDREIARTQTYESHTEATNVRPGWPSRPTTPIIRQPIIEPVALVDGFDDWDEF